MANEPIITIVGNLAGDPELRFTPSGAAVCNFTVAVRPREKQGDEWKDGDTQWYRCAVWREAAENTSESLTKGTRVIVQGRLKHRPYEKDGVQRVSIEIDVDAVGPDLRYATARVNKAQRGGSGGGATGGWSAPTGDWGAPRQAQPDPWSTSPQGAGHDDPPF